MKPWGSCHGPPADRPAALHPDSAVMAYERALEKKLARKMTKAIVDFELIEDGDRVMVGLSGGKDSWALMQLLDALRRRAPVDFTLVAVNVHSGYRDYQHDAIAQACARRGWELRIEHTTIGEIIDDKLDEGTTPCSLCARLRRGVLYRIAGEVGATKIALGHHADDFIETLLLNLFFAGALKAMPARLVSDDRRHVVIRPLAYISEEEARGLYPAGRVARDRLLLPGLWRSGSAAAARQASVARSRTRASGGQAVDAEGSRQRGGAASPGPAHQPGGGAPGERGRIPDRTPAVTRRGGGRLSAPDARPGIAARGTALSARARPCGRVGSFAGAKLLRRKLRASGNR